MALSQQTTNKQWEVAFSAWADGPGKTEQEKCERAERAVKTAVGKYAGLEGWDLTIRAHGSYRVNTSIQKESDVDIYVQLNNSNFFDDYPQGKGRADFGNRDGTLDYADFRARVGLALQDHLGKNAVTLGEKAFDVHENSYRIDADVIAVLPYRWYTGERTFAGDHHFFEGIAFRSSKNNELYRSFPEQTYTNGVGRNDATGRRYKRIIRILKNLRNYMADDYKVTAAKGIASFMIECLVWNVPKDNFGDGEYWEDVYRVLHFLQSNTASYETAGKWTEVNDIRYLWDSRQLWSLQQGGAFVQAAWKFLGFS